jgi:sulfatase maturation enzyme AslB (radical SAM superfamily)
MDNKCILPFIRHDAWKNSPCCKIEQFNYKKDLSRLIDDHKKNKRSKFCNSCWNFEKNGVWSKRQESNQHFKNLGLDISKIDERSIKSLVIPTGNVCNLTCVYCDPNNSSSWRSKYVYMQKQGEINPRFNLIALDKFDNVEWNDIVDIELQGGETLMSKNLWQILDLAKKNTSISLLSNGTVKLNEKQIKQIQNFKNLYITLSIDGVEKIFEYCRRPAKWKHVKDNIEEYKKIIGVNRLSFQITISSLNIFYVDKIMFDLIKILPSYSNINIVTRPVTMSPSALTPKIGKIIEEHNPFFFKTRKIHWQGSDTTMENFLNYIYLQDKFDNMTMQEYLPEFFKLIKEQYPHHLNRT